MLSLLLGGLTSALGSKPITDMLGITGKSEGGDDLWRSVMGTMSPIALGLMDQFGITSGGGGTSPIDKMAQVNQLSNYTATGAEGAAANREAAEAARRSQQVSAEARLGAQRQEAIGSQALSAPQQTTDLARAALQMNLGNQTRALTEQGLMGNPAARAGIASELGQSNIQAMNALAQQGADAQQRAFQTAGQAFASGNQILNADQAQRDATFQKYQLQKASGMNLGQLGGYEQASQQMRASEDVLAPMKYKIGQQGAENANVAYDKETIAQMVNELLAKQGVAGSNGYNTPNYVMKPGFRA